MKPSAVHPAPVLALMRPLGAAIVLLFAFTAIFVEAFHAPHPRDLRVGVVGSPAVAGRIQKALELQQPGAFRVREYESEVAARGALVDTDVHAVFVPSRHGDRVLVASASGVPATRLSTIAFQEVARQAGAELRVTDVVPLPLHDLFGLSALFTVIGTLLPSVGFGAVLARVGARLRSQLRWAAIVVYAVVAGFVAALDVDVVIGALRGNFLGVAAIAGLFALAVAATSHGLARAAGPAGLAFAFVLLLLLGLPSAGGAVTPPLQPDFYSSISGWLPPGAALGALRRAVYFDWAGTARPLFLLGAWALGGVILGLAGDRMRSRRDQAAAAA